MERHVLSTHGFCCVDYSACRASHSGAFFEGQLHHVGAHYDLTLDGRPFRIAVVGQEYGNGPARVTRLLRSRDVVTLTGYGKRFRSDGLHAARNPHMKGTTSVLRLLTGRALGTDYESELLQLDDSAVHLFEAFALTNFLLCTAIPAGLGEVGSKRGKSTSTMQRNCARHFRETMRILEPTVLIVQGKGIRGWMNTVLESAQALSPNLERVRLAGRECFLATFTHPSVPSAENWGTDERRPYLQTVVGPTVSRIHQLLPGE